MAVCVVVNAVAQFRLARRKPAGARVIRAGIWGWVACFARHGAHAVAQVGSGAVAWLRIVRNFELTTVVEVGEIGLTTGEHHQRVGRGDPGPDIRLKTGAPHAHPYPL